MSDNKSQHDFSFLKTRLIAQAAGRPADPDVINLAEWHQKPKPPKSSKL
jgi:hypothetical protein